MPIKKKRIPDFPNYSVNSRGEVFNQKGAKLKPNKSHNGYLRVSLSNDEVKHKHLSIHRLVAEAFIANPYGLPQVDHRNEDKTDNRLKNLRWVSPLDNLKHSHIIEKATVAKYRKVRCITTGEIYNSIKEASESLGIPHSNIVACCNGRRRKCGSLEWEYAE